MTAPSPPSRHEHPPALSRISATAAAIASAVLGCVLSLAPASANAAAPAFDHCFDLHGQAYGVNPNLLRALARTESSMNPRAINGSHQAHTGSVDIGLMQINSRWLPTLSRFGIQREDLHDACTNIEVGAWILSTLMRDKGDSWDAVGAWNAACTELRGDDCKAARARFAWKVFDRLPAQGMQQAAATQPRADVRLGLVRVSALTGSDPKESVEPPTEDTP